MKRVVNWSIAAGVAAFIAMLVANLGVTVLQPNGWIKEWWPDIITAGLAMVGFYLINWRDELFPDKTNTDLIHFGVIVGGALALSFVPAKGLTGIVLFIPRFFQMILSYNLGGLVLLIGVMLPKPRFGRKSIMVAI